MFMCFIENKYYLLYNIHSFEIFTIHRLIKKHYVEYQVRQYNLNIYVMSTNFVFGTQPKMYFIFMIKHQLANLPPSALSFA